MVSPPINIHLLNDQHPPSPLPLKGPKTLFDDDDSLEDTTCNNTCSYGDTYNNAQELSDMSTGEPETFKIIQQPNLLPTLVNVPTPSNIPASSQHAHISQHACISQHAHHEWNHHLFTLLSRHSMPSLKVDLLKNHIILCAQGPMLYNNSDLEVLQSHPRDYIFNGLSQFFSFILSYLIISDFKPWGDSL